MKTKESNGGGGGHKKLGLEKMGVAEPTESTNSPLVAVAVSGDVEHRGPIDPKI